MTQIEIRVLECLCRLEVCSHVKDRILVESDLLYTFVSKNVVSVSDISAVNLIVGWKLCSFRRNSSISFLLLSHTDMMSSINLFQKVGLMQLCLSISFSILAMKMLAKVRAIFVPMAVPWVEDNLSR